MVSELITLPLRIGARAAGLTFQATEQSIRLTGAVAGQVIRALRSDEPAAPPQQPSSPVPPARAVPLARAPVSDPPRRRAIRTASSPRRAPGSTTELFREPAHVSSEPTLVETLAETGAEDGAGPEIHVEEPWPDYAHMAARDIVERLRRATAAELATAQLYERTHRARETVLAAAECALRDSSSRGSRHRKGERNHG